MERIICRIPHLLVPLLFLFAMLGYGVAVGQARETKVRKPDQPLGKHGSVDSSDLKDQQPTKKAAKDFHGETPKPKEPKLASSTVSLTPRKVDTSKKIHLNPPPPKPSNSVMSSSASTLAPTQGIGEPKPHRKDTEIKGPPGGLEEPHHPPHRKRPHVTGCSSLASRQDVEKCKEAESVLRKSEPKK
jgi:hypothetical protein